MSATRSSWEYRGEVRVHQPIFNVSVGGRGVWFSVDQPRPEQSIPISSHIGRRTDAQTRQIASSYRGRSCCYSICPYFCCPTTANNHRDKVIRIVGQCPR